MIARDISRLSGKFPARVEASEKERVVRVRCSHYATGVGVRTRRSPFEGDLARSMLLGCRTMTICSRGSTRTETQTGTPLNAAVNDLQWRIRGEYLEMPGLRLSIEQASRLWALDRFACVELLEHLVKDNFLQCDRDGRYVRKGSGY